MSVLFTMKTFIMLQKISISNECFIFKYILMYIHKKMVMVSTKTIFSTTVFNINNN